MNVAANAVNGVNGANAANAAPRRESRIAMAIGVFLQHTFLALFVMFVNALVLVAGIIQLAAPSQTPDLIAGVSCIAGGASAVVLAWLVWNAPFDMLETLNQTIAQMRERNQALSETESRLRDAVSELVRQNQSLETAVASAQKAMADESARQRATVDAMSRQLETFKSMCGHQQAAVAQLADSVLALEKRDSTTGSALTQVMATLRDHVSVDAQRLHSTVNSFYETLTGLDAATLRNQALSTQLQAMIDQMDRLLPRVMDSDLMALLPAVPDEVARLVADMGEASMPRAILQLARLIKSRQPTRSATGQRTLPLGSLDPDVVTARQHMSSARALLAERSEPFIVFD